MSLRSMHEKLVQLIIDKPKLGIATSGGVTAAGLISLIETATKVGGLLIVVIGVAAAYYNLKVQRHAAEKLEQEKLKTTAPPVVQSTE